VRFPREKKKTILRAGSRRPDKKKEVDWRSGGGKKRGQPAKNWLLGLKTSTRNYHTTGKGKENKDAGKEKSSTKERRGAGAWFLVKNHRFDIPSTVQGRDKKSMLKGTKIASPQGNKPTRRYRLNGKKGTAADINGKEGRISGKPKTKDENR